MQQNKQDADVEKSEDIDEDTNNMDKLRSKKNGNNQESFDDKMNGDAVNTIEYVDKAARCAKNLDPGSGGTYLKLIKLSNIFCDSPQKINQSLIFCSTLTFNYQYFFFI